MRASRGSDGVHAGEQHRTWWGRAWRYWAGPVWYWLDLLDGERRPSHSKVTWTVAFAVALGLLIFVTLRIFARSAGIPSATALAFLLSYTALCLVTAGGLDGVKAWLKTRGGGTVDAFKDVATTEIQARRASVGNDHEPTAD